MANEAVVLLQQRFATRAIEPRPLDEETVADLIEAARLTPSCSNNQPWHYLFLRGDEARTKGCACLSADNQKWACRAPLLIFGWSRLEDDCRSRDGKVYFQFDLGLSAMNLMLAATARGLAARPMAGFSEAKVREAFALPEGAQPLIAIAVGYPGDDDSHVPDYARGAGRKPRERKPAAEIVTIL